MLSKRVCGFCLVIAAATAFPALGTAQSASAVAARRGLLVSATEARIAGNHAQALELAERAGRISMTPSLRLFIASEQVELGRIAEAQGNGEVCVREAERDTSIQNRGAIIDQCRALATSLATRVGRITVVTPNPPPAGMHVRMVGEDIDSAFWGVPYIVTPGTIVIEATAPGHEPFRREVSVSAGQTESVVITLATASGSSEPAQVASAAPASGAPVEAPDAVPTAAIPPPATARHHAEGASIAAPLALAAVGLVAFGAALAANFAMRQPALDALATACPHPEACPGTTANRGHYQDAQTGSIVADVAIGVGVVAIGAAVVAFVLGRPGHHDAVSASVVPGFGGAVIAIGGAL